MNISITKESHGIVIIVSAISISLRCYQEIRVTACESFSTMLLIAKPTKIYTNVFFSLASDHGMNRIMPGEMSIIRSLQILQRQPSPVHWSVLAPMSTYKLMRCSLCLNRVTLAGQL